LGVQHAGGQREPLLPAAGQRAGHLILAVDESQSFQRRIDLRLAILEFIDARDEIQILADRKVFPETEPLGHVAGLALDRLGLRAQL
jgi:hypothetical protein